MRTTVDFHPSENDISVIQMLAEKEKGMRFSLYHNWDIAKGYYKEGHFSVLKLNSRPIGYSAWREYDNEYVKIEFIWMDSFYKKKGFGQEFQIQLSKYFQKFGYAVIVVSCASNEGDKLSKRMGFIPCEHEYCDNNNDRYLPLNPYQTATFISDTSKICKYIEYGSEASSIVRKVSLDNISQSSPLLIDIPSNWNIKLIHQENIILSTQAKRLNKKIRIHEINYQFFVFYEDIF